MGKVKIHEIAKRTGLTSKDVLDVAKKLKIDAKSHLSGVTEEEAEQIEKVLTKKEEKKKDKEKDMKKECGIY